MTAVVQVPVDLAINLSSEDQAAFPTLNTNQPAPQTPIWGAPNKQADSPDSTEASDSPFPAPIKKDHKFSKKARKTREDPVGSYSQITFLNRHGHQESFTVCKHWGDWVLEALDRATRGLGDKKWVSDFTPLHYACQKNNAALVKFLLEAPECGAHFRHWVHVVDDFFEKPLDHLCNAKGAVPKTKQSLADYVISFMNVQPFDRQDPKEVQYQDIKLHGPLHLRKSEEEKMDLSKMVDATGQEIVIASGETGPDLTNVMTPYEVEENLPSDMRKNFKVVAKSGFDNFTGNWTKGESPLHWAASRGRTDICRMLILVLKANPESEDDKGRTAIKLAKTKKHHQLAKMLHTLDFPIERDAEVKAKKDAARKNPTVAPKLAQKKE